MALADPKKTKVTHILKDGTVLDSIEGYVPKLDDTQIEVLTRIFISVSEKKARRLREEKNRENNQ